MLGTSCPLHKDRVWSKGLQGRMILWFGGLFLAVLMLVLLVINWGVPRSGYSGRISEIRVEIFQHLNHLADLKKQLVVEWLSERHRSLRFLARNPDLIEESVRFMATGQEVERVAITQRLVALDEAYPEILRAELLDPGTGRVVISSQKSGVESVDYSDPFLRHAWLSRNGFVDRVVLDYGSGHPVFPIGHAIRNRDGNTIAILVALVTPRIFLQTLLQTGQVVGQSRQVYLVDDQGNLVTSLGTIKSSWSIEPSPVLLGVPGQEGIFETTDTHGVPVIAAIRHIRVNTDWGWSLVIKQDQAEMFSPVVREIVLVVGAGGLGFVLVVLLTILMARRLGEPLLRLSHTASALARGEMSARTGLDQEGEIGELGRVFDFMAGRIQETLANSEEQFRQLEVLINSSPDGIFAFDQKMRLTVWNPTMTHLFGLSREECLGQKLAALIPFGANLARKRQCDFVLAGEETEVLEQVHIHSLNGERMVLEERYSPLRSLDGEICGGLVAIRDIAVRKQAEEESRLARELADAANRAKSIFLANMSHELRTPINAILGFSQIMSRDPELNEKQKENLDIILNSSAHLQDIINAILDMAKIESGKMEVDLVDIDLGGLIHDLIDMLRLRADSKGLELRLDQSSSFPSHVRTDPAKLRQIIINIIGNAIKFTNSGYIVLKLSLCDALLFEITDSGIGISAESLEKIQQPFVQLAQSGGTGLGLSISRQLIGLLGGEMRIASELGKGTTFSFTIPFVPVTGTPPHASDNGEIVGIDNGCEYRILIVEDQRENRLLLQNLLSQHNFQLRSAEDGREGVRVFQEWHPHLVLMDRRMPVLDGLSATREIRALPDGKEVKIIAVTAHTFNNERMEMLEAGCDDVLAKPFSESGLYDIMKKYLSFSITRQERMPAVVLDAVLDPVALAKLPVSLLRELDDSLVRLDMVEITQWIQQVAGLDEGLGKIMKIYGERFEFMPIRKAIQAIIGGK
ncbi:MAG: response regulator [Magnetococcales bacterium]|nr:response regulator [Magnetococcales bacterium]